MIAVLAGLLTAIAWASATLAAARASRTIGPSSATAFVTSIGLAATLPLLLLDRPPTVPEPGDLAWLVVVGVCYALGMILSYAALAKGKVPIAAPIASTEGAVAAVLAILTGEAAEAPLIGLFVLIVVGIVLVTLRPGGGIDLPARGDARYVLFAMCAAGSFGLGLYAAGRASALVPLSWTVVAGRLAGVLLVALPMIVVRRLRWRSGVLPFLLAAGLLEVAGAFTFAWGARESIATTAVLSSQFAVMAAVAAHVTGERIAPRQWLGVVLVAVSVTLVTVVRL